MSKIVKISDIEDYLYCPMKYYLKDELGLKNFNVISDLSNFYEDRLIWEEYRSEVMINTILKIMNKMTKKKEITVKEAETIFGKEFYKNVSPENMLTVESTYASGGNPYLTDFLKLQEFLKVFFKTSVFPIIAGDIKTINIDGVNMEGKIHLVAQTSKVDKRLTIIKLYYPMINKFEPTKVIMDYDLGINFTTAYIEPKIPLTACYKAYYNLHTFSYRFKRPADAASRILLKNIVFDTLEDIERKRFRAQPSVRKCAGCSYLKVCNEYLT